MSEECKSAKNICFVSNYTKTIFFHEVAKLLEANGYTISWIIVDRKYYDLLLKQYPAERFLLIGKHYSDTVSDAVGDFKINELIRTDRVLRNSQKWAREYLINIQRPLYDFIEKNEVRFVLGELTWAHELLIYRMIKQNRQWHCTYLNPHTIRIPNGRFAFFNDEFQSKIIERNQFASSKEEVGNGFSIAKPSYLQSNNLLLKRKNSFAGLSKRTFEFLTNKHHDDLNDPTRSSKFYITRLRILEQLRIYSYKFFVHREPFKNYRNQSFVIYSLHKQPEASIDVMGRYYEDQLQNILNVWRILPDNWVLLVKEHTNAIGDRGLNFYRKLKNLKGVHIIRETEDMTEMLRYAKAVFTVSGTVAIEAMLQDKIAFTFARNFFNEYGKCFSLTLEDLKYVSNFEHLCKIAEKKSAGKTSEEYQDFILKNSFRGIIGDVLHTPGAMEPENVALIAKAIDETVSNVQLSEVII